MTGIRSLGRGGGVAVWPSPAAGEADAGAKGPAEEGAGGGTPQSSARAAGSPAPGFLGENLTF